MFILYLEKQLNEKEQLVDINQQVNTSIYFYIGIIRQYKNSKIQSMTLNYIEDYADAALNSLDPNIKFQAEAAFKKILSNLSVQQYPLILQNYSQNVAFVFLLLLSKQVPKSPQLIDIFKILQDIAQQWHLPNGQFKRPTDTNFLPYHIINTLGNTIGICMKQIYLFQKSKNELVAFLQNHQNQLFKLFLYNHFIEAVSTIDDQSDHINYQRVVEQFQQKMIPIILKELYPYFISVTDKMKIYELSSMLPTLSQKVIQHQYDLFRPQDKNVSHLVFNLLKEIVSFKYNITLSQYDFEGESDYFLITFPESILSVLNSKQFLEAFYFMLQKMASMDYIGTHLQTSFDCLKRIILSKFQAITQEQKIQIIHLHYIGLLRLVKANVTSQRTLEKILECIDKFFHNFGLNQLEKNKINHIELSTAINQKAIMIVNGTELSSDNRLFMMVCQVMSQIAKESFEHSQQKYISFYKNMCRDFYMKFFESFITKDFLIMGKSNVHKISGLEQILEDFFKLVNNIGGMDMGFLFGLLLSKSSGIFMSENPKKIANFIFLITFILQENFFDRNIIYEVTSNSQLQPLGTLIRSCFEFMDLYKKSQFKDKMLDVAILLFLQRILDQFLSNLGNNDEKIMITSKTYEVINMGNNILIGEEGFLMFCFDELQENLNSQDHQKVEYVLESLYKNLLKLKHTLRRESFVETMISKNILQKTIELSQNSMQQSVELLRQRRKLYKIITILSFDDLLDSYRSNIDYVVEQLTQDFRDQRYAKIVFDMSGICEHIETASIYRYFLTRINGAIGLENLLRTLYEYFAKQGVMLEQVVFLNYTLLCDKSLRMSQKQLSFLIYEIIDYSLNYLSEVLDFVRNGQWSDLLNQVLKLANLLFEASYINLFLIKRKCKEKLIAFMYKLIDNILANYEWAHQLPELSFTFHETIQLVLTNASEAIITWIWTLEAKNQQQEFMNKFIRLIQFSMDLCLHQLESAAFTSKKCYLSEKILETISKLFSFMRYKKNSLHRQSLIQTIDSIKIQNEVHSIKFLEGLYKISMTNIKNIKKAFNEICICIMEVTYFYPNAHEGIFISLGISGEIIKKNEWIFKKIQNGKEDELFINNLKRWLSIKENLYNEEFVDY